MLTRARELDDADPSPDAVDEVLEIPSPGDVELPLRFKGEGLFEDVVDSGEASVLILGLTATMAEEEEDEEEDGSETGVEVFPPLLPLALLLLLPLLLPELAEPDEPCCACCCCCRHFARRFLNQTYKEAKGEI